MPLLKCIGLAKEYKDHGDTLAVDNVNLQVDKGEIVALVGPEGAGKTTAYRLVCGLLSPTNGRILFNGVDVTDWMPDRRERLGIRFVTRNSGLHLRTTVHQSLLEEAQSLEINLKPRRSQVDDLLVQFGLNWRKDEIVDQLSFGERTRLEIAKCLIGEPSLILLDEPFEGLDIVTMHSIESTLSEVVERGISVLLTDRRGREILRLAHRTYVLCHGKVLISGDARTVLCSPDARREYFGDEGRPRPR
jgi:lipopolysaccharide export system ATP-binding protein